MFSELKSVNWISKINLSKGREEQISSCFQYTKVSCNYPNDLNEFDAIIENFQRKTRTDNGTESDTDDNENIKMLGEKKIGKSIYMEEVTGHADKSNNFGSFLTVLKKFGCICIYIFHILYPLNVNWQMITSQTKISIYFLVLFSLLAYLNFCWQIAIVKLLITYRLEISGSIDSILRFLILGKKFVPSLTVET